MEDMAAIRELSDLLGCLDFTQADRTPPILFIFFIIPKSHSLSFNKIPKLNDGKAALDPGLQIGGRNGDERGAGALGDEDVAGGALEGRVGVEVRRGLEEAQMGGEKLQLEQDSGEEMDDLRASLAVNGEIEEPHQIFVEGNSQNPAPLLLVVLFLMR